MSTETLARPAPNASAMMFSVGDIAVGLAPKMHFEKNSEGADVLIVEDVAVFRSGSFSDSMGRRNTWEHEHLASMVTNFNMLRDRNIFSDVPVRSGHPGWLINGQEGNGKVVGYHRDLRVETRQSTHDDNEYEYLITSYEIIDPEAQQAIKSGLWRNRSAEVGTYITNDDAEYFPVYFGVAYVDIPAVEGLNGFAKSNHNTRIIEEESMSADQQVVTPVAPKLPTAPAVPVAPEVSAHTAPVVAEPVTEPVVQAQPVVTHGQESAVMAFSIDGRQVQDFAAVQQHINVLEAFRNETIESARVDFVNGLVKDGKILASNADATVEFAKSLSDEQFGAWRTTQEAAPQHPILGQFDAGQGGDPVVPTEGPTEVETLAAIVRQHKRAGKSIESIKGMESYKKLLGLDPNFKL